MDEIYSLAECTWVWLVLGDELTDKAIAWLSDKFEGFIIEEVVRYASAPTC